MSPLVFATGTFDPPAWLAEAEPALAERWTRAMAAEAYERWSRGCDLPRDYFKNAPRPALAKVPA